MGVREHTDVLLQHQQQHASSTNTKLPTIMSRSEHQYLSHSSRGREIDSRDMSPLPGDDPFGLCVEIVKSMRDKKPEVLRKSRMGICVGFDGDKGHRCNYFMRNFGADAREMLDQGKGAHSICRSLDFNKRPPRGHDNSDPADKVKSMKKRS